MTDRYNVLWSHKVSLETTANCNRFKNNGINVLKSKTLQFQKVICRVLENLIFMFEKPYNFHCLCENPTNVLGWHKTIQIIRNETFIRFSYFKNLDSQPTKMELLNVICLPTIYTKIKRIKTQNSLTYFWNTKKQTDYQQVIDKSCTPSQYNFKFIW